MYAHFQPQITALASIGRLLAITALLALGMLLLFSQERTSAASPPAMQPDVAAGWRVESNQEGAEFGVSVSTAGDLNRDGYAEVVVGSHRYDNDQSDEGRVFIYYGSATGLSTTADLTLEANQPDAWFGHSVTTAGDVNHDGYADLLVGTPRYDGGEENSGQVYVFYGSALGVNQAISWTVALNQNDAGLGGYVDTAGDVNGDGYDDVLVGANSYDNDEINEGAAFVFHGSAVGLDTIPDWTGESNQADADYGYKVSRAGDVNGDGYSDIIVGARFYDNGETDEGAAFVYHGSADGLSLTPDWMGESNQPGANYGPVSTAGDVNGDGYADVVVGAYRSERAYAYYGSPTGLALSPDWTAQQLGGYFGIEVATVGDVNSDGFADVMVGAFQHDNGTFDEGAAFLYYGSAEGLSLDTDWMVDGNNDSSRFGGSIDPAGDVNGDGYGDLIIGARLFDNGQLDEGRAFVYYGTTGGPAEPTDVSFLTLQAIQPGLLLPLSLLLIATGLTLVMLFLFHRSGRNRGRP